jgi:hypothetical protein
MRSCLKAKAAAKQPCKGICPAGSGISGLEAIVANYVGQRRKCAAGELRWFRKQPTLRRAVSLAALAQGEDGKLHHQWRIPSPVLGKSRHTLLSYLPALRRTRSFEELHELIRSKIASIRGIGPLAIYDTTLRIGAKLKLEPSIVFLHAGTRVGAKRLGLDVSRGILHLDELPSVFRRLSAREIEDVLCIYKDNFRSRSWTKRGAAANGTRAG